MFKSETKLYENPIPAIYDHMIISVSQKRM